MSTLDTIRNLGPDYHGQPFSLAFPKLPTAMQDYSPYVNTQNNTNATDYVANAMGFLPINVRQLSNSTNGYAYNSVADVALNKEAWEKRWGDTSWSWLSDWYGYIPRTIVDSAILLWDTTVNPIVDSVKLAVENPHDDVNFFEGLFAGVNTAVLNNLVNFGNTADVLANPIKGFFLDGPEGFIKGSIGTRDGGRKQYDYIDYIDTGSGVADFILSMGAEIASDPLTYVTLGSWLGAKAGGKAAATTANVAVDSITKSLTSLAKTGFKYVDDAADPVVDAAVKTIVKEAGDSVSETTARTILKSVVDDAGTISTDAVDGWAKNTRSLLSKTVQRNIQTYDTRALNTDVLLSSAERLRNAKTPRFKAALINKAQYTPSVQNSAADLLENLQIDKLPNLGFAKGLNKLNNISDRVIRDAALYTSGVGPALLVKKGANWATDVYKNSQAKRYVNQGVFNAIKDMDPAFRIDYNKAVEATAHIKEFGAVGVSKKFINEDIVDGIDDIYNKYNGRLMRFTAGGKFKHSADRITGYQKEALKELDELINTHLGSEGIHTFEEYTEYISRVSNDNLLYIRNNRLNYNINDAEARKILEASAHLKSLDEHTQGIQRILNADMYDKGNFYNIITANQQLKRFLNTYKTQFGYTQQQNIDDYTKALRDYRKQKKLEYKGTPKGRKSDSRLDKYVRYILKEHDNLTEQLPKHLNGLWADRYPDTTDAITGSIAEPRKIIENNYTLNEAYNNYLKAYDEYNEALMDVVELSELRKVKTKLVSEYNDLVKNHIIPLTKFKDTADLNISNADELINEIGERYLKHNVPEFRGDPDALYRNTPIGRAQKSADGFVKEVQVSQTRAHHFGAEALDLQSELKALELDYRMGNKSSREVATKILKLQKKYSSFSEFSEVLEGLDKSLKSKQDFQEAVSHAVGRLDTLRHGESLELTDLQQQLKNLEDTLEVYLNDTLELTSADNWALVDSYQKAIAELSKKQNLTDVEQKALQELTERLKTYTDAGDAVSYMREQIEYTRNILNAVQEETKVTKVVQEIKTEVVQVAHTTATATDVGDYIRSLKTFRLSKEVNTVDLSDYIKAELVTYTVMHSKTQFITELVYGIFNKSEDVTEVYDAKAFITKENMSDLFELYPDKAEALASNLNPAAVKDLAKQLDNDIEFYAKDLFKEIQKVDPDFSLEDFQTWLIDAYKTKSDAFYTNSMDDLSVKFSPDSDKVTTLAHLTDDSEDAVFDSMASVENTMLMETLLEQHPKLKPSIDKLNAHLALVEQVKILGLEAKTPAAVTKVAKPKKVGTLSKILSDYKDESSDLYQFLNHPRNEKVVEIADFKATLKRLDDFKTLVTAVEKLAADTKLDPVHREGLIDALVSEIDKNHGFKIQHLDSIAHDMLNTANLYFRSHTDAPSLAMDTQLVTVAESVLKDKSASASAKETAQQILDSLKEGLAHGANTDVDNLTRMLSIHKGLSAELSAKAKGKYRVIFDTETTGTLSDKNAHIFQISARIIDENGNDVCAPLNYIINPGNHKPPRATLKKLAPGGVAPDVWWAENVMTSTLTIDDAMTSFYKALTPYLDNGIVWVGHNINEFDLPMLNKFAKDSRLKELLNTADYFDTLEHMVRNNMFELQGEQRAIFLSKLKDILISAQENGNTALKHKLFTWSDMQNMSAVKSIIKESYTGSSGKPLAKDTFEWLSADARGAVDAEQMYQHILNSEAIKDLEEAIDGINESWYRARLVKNSGQQFTVSKAAIHSEEMQQIVDSLISKGLINVPGGVNIMTFINRYTKNSDVFLNPKTAISYEFQNAFDMAKIEKAFNGTRVSRDIAEQITHQSKCIMNTKSWLTDDMVDALKDDAQKLLTLLRDSGLIKENHINLLYDFADNSADLTVAAAVYYHGLAKKSYENMTQVTKLYKANANEIGELLSKFDDIYATTAAAKNVEWTPSPLLSRIDPKTNQPVALYESTWYSYVDVAKQQKNYNPLDVITRYNVDNHIYSAHDAIIHSIYDSNALLAKEVMQYLDTLPANTRKTVEQNIRHYNSFLSTAAKSELLERPDRVQKFIEEGQLRAGRCVFRDSKILDLSDFEKAGIVVARVPTDAVDETGARLYEYWLGLTEELYKTSNADITAVAKVVPNKAVALPQALQDSLLKARQRLSTYVHNIHYSNGDVLTKELVETFDSKAPLGFTDKVVNVNFLEANGYFNSLRANNMVIGNTMFQQEFNEFFVTDPFKQVFHTSRAYVDTHLQNMSGFMHLLYNDATGLGTSDLFKDFDNGELAKLAKQNPNMRFVYLAPSSSKWSKTGTVGTNGVTYVLKEIPILNAKSVEIAKKLNAHILPTEQFLQMSKAINTFELPPIAKFFNNISKFYKIGYLSSIGFVVRNLIDSNYKNRWALDGTVSMPQQIKHLWETSRLIYKYNNLSESFAKLSGHVFKTNLEYDVFIKWCNNFGDADAVNKIVSTYSEDLRKKVTQYLTQFDGFTDVSTDVIQAVQKNTIDPQMFSIMDSFIKHGPSAGLSRSVLNTISKGSGDIGVTDKLLKWWTEDTPMRLVFDTNDLIEQSARLSLYLQRLEMGDNVNEALQKVIKTHFDYSDKSLGMMYTEIVFPFMSFSYKNLNFWIETIAKNPRTVRELDNILRTCLNYQSLFNPDQEAYEEFDYSFDWSKNITGFGPDAPWQTINAARLYHILSGNVTIASGKNVKHDNGYGSKDSELYYVFKLSPSVLDAVRMLYNPLDQYSQRMLPPAKVLMNTFDSVLKGESPVEDVGINSVLNNLPFVGATLQRMGAGNSNNILKRIEDAGLPMAVSSLFSAAYVPTKKYNTWYDAEGNYLTKLPQYEYRNNAYYHKGGGFVPNYSTRRSYANPYSFDNPTYTISKLARRSPNKPLYSRSKKYNIKNSYSSLYNSRTKDSLIKNRVLDKYRYL